MRQVPRSRISACNAAPVHPGRDYVLYWMIAARRVEHNYGLQHAIERARALRRPLIVLEPLRAGYRWSSARHHRFVLDGMADNRARFAGSPVAYHPYVERAPGEGSGLLAVLARRAVLVVTDEFPCFFLPHMVAAAGARLDTSLEQVDGNGLLPLRAAPGAFPTAHAFRRFLQKSLLPHLDEAPEPAPLQRADLPPAAVPDEVLARWPAASDELLRGGGALAAIVDGSVPPAPVAGGAAAGAGALARFLERGLDRYAEEHNAPEADASSGLSPYLHFGHVSPHAVFAALAAREGWDPGLISGRATGGREGFWGMSAPAESFLDQLLTWRELGYVFCHHRPDYERFDSLPAWALDTLRAHASDPRPVVYDLETLEAGATHDPLWNAAQGQLRAEGRIHNYLRMLWGKKVLEWSPTPEAAWATLVHLNNKYALDGRDPNSYSGISWTFGRFDRPWGPRRPIFGTVRYMSSENTARKFRVSDYVRRWTS